jgi:transposase
MSEKRVNKSDSKEFKEEALALISEQDYSVAQAASAVGVRTINCTNGSRNRTH